MLTSTLEVEIQQSLEGMWCSEEHEERESVATKLSRMDPMKKLWAFWWIALTFSSALVLIGTTLIGGLDGLGTAMAALGVVGIIGCAAYASSRM